MPKKTSLALFTIMLALKLGAQTYFFMSQMTNGTSGPPYPENPFPTYPVYPQANDVYWVDDRYQTTSNGSLSSASMTTSGDVFPSDGSDTNGIPPDFSPNISFPDASYLTNGSLWIEALSNDTQNIFLRLHNTTDTVYYQIWMATNVAFPSTNWTPGQVLLGQSDTNQTDFNFVPMTNAQTFFMGQQAPTIAAIFWQSDAYETNSTLGIGGQPGYVVVQEEGQGVSYPLTVYYTLSGTARNGIDYTSLSGSVVIPGVSTATSVPVYVQPIGPTTLTNPIESVIFTLQPNTNYLIDPNFASDDGIQNPLNPPVLIHSSSTTVSISWQTNAVRPIAAGQPAQDGQFQLERNDQPPGTNPGNYSQPLTVYYQITGTAANGVDYQFLSDSVTFQPADGGPEFTNIDIVPLAESVPEGIKTVTLTLISSNGYVADPNSYSTNINIFDQTNFIDISGVVGPAINQNGPSNAPAQDGAFTIERTEPQQFLPPLTVNYKMDGEASNGVDYSFVGNSVTFSNGQSSATIPIHPISAWTNQFKTVTMTLLPGDYVIDTSNFGGGPAETNIDNSSTEVSVVLEGQDGIEAQGTNAVPGVFELTRSDTRGSNDALSVVYTLSGSATNGIDYTNLSGVITFAAGQTETNIFIQPLLNTTDPGDKTVIISLIPQTYYFIDTNNASTQLLILDTNVVFQTVTNGPAQPQQPTGINYDPFLTNLVLSWEGGFLGSDFDRLGTNITHVGTNTVTNLLFTNWSTINGLSNEVYLTIVTNGSSSRFTNGDMFFGSDTGIGWLSSNAAASNLNWCILSNAVETNALLLRGAICMDTTGAFSNNIIAVTSDDDEDSLLKGVWEVDSHAHPTLLTNITASLLEGVTVLPANFGPWSHKIITGDENSTSLYIIDTNGALTTFDSTNLFPDGIHSESITMIPANQSLYLCDPWDGLIVKLPKSLLTNYTGDLLIADGGEAQGDTGAKLFIINWDPVGSNYVTRRILYNFGSQKLEGAAFAPIELPAQ